MRKPGLVLPEGLQRQIRSSAQEFAGDVIGIVQLHIQGLALGFLAGTPRARKAPTPVGKRPGVAKKIAPVVANRVSGDLAANLIALLRKNGEGLGAEKINAALGTTSKDLVKPIAQLMAEGRVKRTGQARGTRYLVA